VQAACVITEQTPVVEQQAPVCAGGGQLLGVQLVHSPCHTFGDRQFACVVIEQAPAGVQQAPVGAHGFELHSTPSPLKVPA